MSHLIVGGERHPAPEGLLVTATFEDGAVRFARRKRAVPVTMVVVHESTTRSAATCIAVLERRGLGVHLLVHPDGNVTQHGDLLSDRLGHAGALNPASVAIEVVGPYYPTALRPGLPWTDVIEAPWAHRGGYVLPTRAQAEATAQLLAWLSGPQANAAELAIPRRWVGVDGTTLALCALPRDRRAPAPGIWAHGYAAHADGWWPLLYAWLRLEGRLASDAAYDEARRVATGIRRRVDLTPWMEASA